MARIIDAFSQFLDGNGDPLANGYLNFFQNKTAIAEPTYNDPAQTVVNPVNVPLDGEGRMALNAYAEVLCTVKLFNSVNSQVDSEDDVTPRGGLTAGAAFDNWDDTTNFVAIISFTTGSDGEIYQAKQNSTGVDPVVDFAGVGLNWKRVSFNEFWTASETYDKNEIKLSKIDGNEYISTKNSNIGVEPSGDTTGTNWVINIKETDFAIGREYLAGARAISKVDFRRYRSQTTQTGNEPSVDSGTNWLPIDGVVTKPVNALPADIATDVSRTPLLTTDAYAITGSTNDQEWIQYQLSADSFASVVYDSGITRDFSGHTVSDALNAATVYSYRAITKGVRTDITEFSTITTFTTTPSLTDVFSINSDTGTASLRFTTTGVDLSGSSGSIWVKNRDTTGFLKKVDTTRGTDDFDFANNTPEVVNAQGVTAYLATGFNSGTDADYNGSGNTISSFSFQNSVGFHDTVRYTGNGIDRVIAHGLGSTVGAMIVKNENEIADLNSFFYLWHKDGGLTGYNLNGNSGVGLAFGVVDSSTFGLGTTDQTNESGDNFICELFAHNPTQGIFCGTYTGTGASGLKLTTGFPVGLLITQATSANATNRGTHIADIVTGTGTHIHAQETGIIEVAGSVTSFDSDGVTLNSNGLNGLGETYYYIAIADPLQF
jgi:hypothetical protein